MNSTENAATYVANLSGFTVNYILVYFYFVSSQKMELVGYKRLHITLQRNHERVF